MKHATPCATIFALRRGARIIIDFEGSRSHLSFPHWPIHLLRLVLGEHGERNSFVDSGPAYLEIRAGNPPMILGGSTTPAG